MGETADAYLEKWVKAEQRFNALRARGKLADEINSIYENEILNEMKGKSALEKWNRFSEIRLQIVCVY